MRGSCSSYPQRARAFLIRYCCSRSLGKHAFESVTITIPFTSMWASSWAALPMADPTLQDLVAPIVGSAPHKLLSFVRGR